MLEHVRKAGLALGIVHRAGVHIRVERNHRRLVPLHDDEVQAIRQRKLRDAFFEFSSDPAPPQGKTQTAKRTHQRMEGVTFSL